MTDTFANNHAISYGVVFNNINCRFQVKYSMLDAILSLDHVIDFFHSVAVIDDHQEKLPIV